MSLCTESLAEPVVDNERTPRIRASSRGAVMNEAVATIRTSPNSCLLAFAKANGSSLDSTPPRTPLPSSFQMKQDREIFGAVRRQIEAVEERLNGQISRLQQQCERTRDTTVARLDSKVSTIELFQPKVDRRLAELSGNFKALSEESQTQIRRTDQMDSRLWDWRHKLDEEIRTKFASIEQMNQELAASFRVQKAASEDSLKRYHQRILRLEQLADERSAHGEELSTSLMHLHTRLLEIEHDPQTSARAASGLQVSVPEEQFSNGVGTDVVETHLHELDQRIVQMQEEAYDLRAKLESQQEHHKYLRTLFEAKDDQYRSLDDRINRENWEGRLKELQRSVDELGSGSLGHSEQFQILQRKVESHEETQAEMGGHIRRLQERGTSVLDHTALAALTSDNSQSEPAPTHAGGHVLADDISNCLGRLDKSEAQLEELQVKVDAVCVEQEVASRVGALVDSLKDVSPKVIAHEESIKQLHNEVNDLQTQARSTTESLAARVRRLEEEVHGGQMDSADDAYEEAEEEQPKATAQLQSTVALGLTAHSSAATEPREASGDGLE